MIEVVEMLMLIEQMEREADLSHEMRVKLSAERMRLEGLLADFEMYADSCGREVA